MTTDTPTDVSEAMVEAFCEEFYGRGGIRHAGSHVRERIANALQAALTAAEQDRWQNDPALVASHAALLEALGQIKSLAPLGTVFRHDAEAAIAQAKELPLPPAPVHREERG